jgi:ribosome-associated protein
MPGPLRVSARIVIPEAELHWRFSRSSGPGGQAVNTGSSRVELSFDVLNSEAFTPMMRERAVERLQGRLVDGVITIAASERRSQFQNRLAAENRLVELLQMATAPPPRTRRPTRPTLSSKRTRVQDKRRRGDVKKGRGKPDVGD